jgi:hypothetical protein
MESEPSWAALAQANIDLARRQDGTGHGQVMHGDATALPRRIPLQLHGRISLVFTSPPYGKTMHCSTPERKTDGGKKGRRSPGEENAVRTRRTLIVGIGLAPRAT